MKYFLLSLIFCSPPLFAKDCKRLIELITTTKELVVIENGLKIVEECRKEGLPYGDVSALLAQLYIFNKDFPNVIKWVEELKASHPDSPTIPILLCQTYNSQKNEEKSILHCNEGAKHPGPYQALMYHLSGKWLFLKSTKTRNLTEALAARKYLVKSLEIDQDMTENNYYIGLIEVIRKDIALAKIMFKKSCEKKIYDSCKFLEEISK